MAIEYLLLVGSLLIFISVAKTKLADDLGIPPLLLFLAIGMLADSEEPGGIDKEVFLIQNVLPYYFTPELIFFVLPNGSIMINPHVEIILPSDREMILIGSVDSEERFFRRDRPRE